MRKRNNILISSASSKIAVINSLKSSVSKMGAEMLLYSADSTPEVEARYFTDKFWNIPKISSLSALDIIAYCKKEDIGFIIPTRDGDLNFFASIKQELEKENISVMVPCVDTVSKCLDKLLFYETCKNFCLPAIKTSEDISTINADKYVVKERYGAGSRSIGIALSKNDAIAHGKKLENPVFQPFYHGKEYSIDTYLDKKGNVKGAIARERIKIINGEAKITQKVDIPCIESITDDLVRKLNVYGHSVTQIIIDDNNVPHIIECNTRFGGASVLSVACGLDSFYWFLSESMGEDISGYPFLKQEKQLKLIRYEADLII